MSQFVFTMTYRMVAIAATCLVLLCILLFVLGVQIGKLMVAPVALPAPASLSVPSGAAGATPSGAVAPAAVPSTNP